MKFKREMRWEFWLSKVESNWVQWDEEGEEKWWNKEQNLKEKKWVQRNVLDFPLAPHSQCDKGMFKVFTSVCSWTKLLKTVFTSVCSWTKLLKTNDSFSIYRLCDSFKFLPSVLDGYLIKVS